MANIEQDERAELIEVEVACAVEGFQKVVSVRLPIESSIRDAISQSDILSAFPSLEQEEISFGIYGKLAPETTLVKEGDRVEIYRPLVISPMEARRLRAKRKKGKGSKKS